MRGCGLTSRISEHGLLAGPYEHCNGPRAS